MEKRINRESGPFSPKITTLYHHPEESQAEEEKESQPEEKRRGSEREDMELRDNLLC